MKNTLITACFLLLIASCKKEEITQSLSASQTSNSLKNSGKYLQNVKRYLKDSLSNNDFASIDFKKTIATRFDSGKIFLLRLQLKKPGNEFILIKTDSLGNCSKGMILNISYSNLQNQSDLKTKFHSFNGNIVVSSLKRQLIHDLKIKNGYKEKANMNGGELLADDNTLPDVTVTAYIPAQGGISYADWYSLLDLYSPQELGFTNGGGGGYGGTTYGYYSPIDPYDYGYTEYNHVPVEDPKQISYEDPLLPPGISLVDYLKCFDNISDDGATCSIEIFTDLPVNGEPNTFFDWTTGSPGHTFLQIKKQNGTETVQQNIGFYPNQGWKTMFYTPVGPKFVDDAGHEFNASLKMTITPEQLHTVITTMKSLIDAPYDIDEYNCTDFALQVFNSVRVGNELVIPRYIIPGETLGIESNTPQGLYQELSSMKEAYVSEAANITIPGVYGFVGNSNGPCN